jgi:hypothetical protein
MPLNKQDKTCGKCRYFTLDVGECYANPPVIIEALVVRALKAQTCDIIEAGSFRPTVELDDPACRFFEDGDAS